MFKNHTTPLWKSWTALGFSVSKKFRGKLQFRQITKATYILFKGRNIFPKKLLLQQGPNMLRRLLHRLEDLLSFSVSAVGKVHTKTKQQPWGHRCLEGPCGCVCPCMHCFWSSGAWRGFQHHQNLAHSNSFHLKKDASLQRTFWHLFWWGKKKKKKEIYSLITRTRKHKSRLALRHLTQIVFR